MNTGTRLAITASLLTLGLALSASPGFAGEAKDTVAESEVSSPDQHSREHAKAATEAATSDAVNAVRAATRLDLDIRLIGRTSRTVAAGS